MNVYDIKWLLYVVITFALTIIALILLHRFVKKESTKETWLKIFALSTLFVHISIYYYNYLFREPNAAGVSTFFPVYPCNVSMMLFPLLFFFGPKTKNFLMTFLAYYGVFGGIITMFEPSSFYQGGDIFAWGTFKSFLSHSLLLLTSLYAFVSGFVKINIKNIVPFVVGLVAIFLPVGIFINLILVHVDPNINAMYLRFPPLPEVPLLNAYFISFLMVVVVVIFITFFDRFAKEKEDRWYAQLIETYKKRKIATE